MSKTSAVKPPNIPVVNETKSVAQSSSPTVEAIAWYETGSAFKAVRFKVELQHAVEVRDLTPEGPKPRHHVADTLKVALVNGFINPVGGQ